MTGGSCAAGPDALLLAVPRLAALAPFPGDREEAVVVQARALEALAPVRRGALVGRRCWEARALLPPRWERFGDEREAREWAAGSERLHVARVTRPGVATVTGSALARLPLGGGRWRRSWPASLPWVQRLDLSVDLTCLRESLALLAPVLDTDWVNAYLLRGPDRRLLFDTGCGIADYGPLVRGVGGSEPLVLLSHADWDHAGGRAGFPLVHCHAAGLAGLRRRPPSALVSGGLRALGRPEAAGSGPVRGTAGVVPLRGGERFALGGDLTLEVIAAQGHTRGDTVLWDEAHGRLFSGDLAYLGPLYVTDLPAFAASVRRLADLPGLREVYGGHGPLPAPADLLGEVAAAAGAVLARRVPGVPCGASTEYRFGRFSLVVSARATAG